VILLAWELIRLLITDYLLSGVVGIMGVKDEKAQKAPGGDGLWNASKQRPQGAFDAIWSFLVD
jgi:hypothetical protein